MADWSARFFAFLIDALVVGVPWIVVLSFFVKRSATISSSLNSTASFTRGAWAVLGIGFIAVLGYFSFLDGSPRGQTIGKRALNIAVKDLRTGAPIGAGRALGRRFFFFATYMAFIFPFFLNGLWPLWDPLRQAWHDKVVASCVVRVR